MARGVVTSNLRRRTILATLGAAPALCLLSGAAQAQQPAPVIGFLGSQAAVPNADSAIALQEGLSETGYTVGRNVTIEYRWAEDHYDRLPAMAADLVRRQVAVIVASGGNVSAVAAKAATSSIPVVFPVATDPVNGGLVASINRPGGNVTGIAALTIELDPKRLELLCEIAPTARAIGALIDSNRPEAKDQMRALEGAARSVGRSLVLRAIATEGEIDAAIDSLSDQADALLIGASPLFFDTRDRIVAKIASRARPAVYQFSEFATAGGLMSYGASRTDSYRQAGIYVGRILKGEKPADLPVLQPVKFDLVINLKAARALGLNVPQPMLALATEVIE